MRLRLTVQRQGLPQAQILWDTRGVRAIYNENQSHTTIAQLLEEVNEVIPLESEDWGLEDYAVEVNGFDCLHFCYLTQVLKEEDNVTFVRYLKYTNLKLITNLEYALYKRQTCATGKYLVATKYQWMVDTSMTELRGAARLFAEV